MFAIPSIAKNLTAALPAINASKTNGGWFNHSVSFIKASRAYGVILITNVLFLAFVNWVTNKLDKKFDTKDSKLKLFKQIGLNVAIPSAFSLAFNAFLSKIIQYPLNKTQFVAFIIAITAGNIIFNKYCTNRTKILDGQGQGEIETTSIKPKITPQHLETIKQKENETSKLENPIHPLETFNQETEPSSAEEDLPEQPEKEEPKDQLETIKQKEKQQTQETETASNTELEEQVKLERQIDTAILDCQTKAKAALAALEKVKTITEPKTANSELVQATSHVDTAQLAYSDLKNQKKDREFSIKQNEGFKNIETQLKFLNDEISQVRKEIADKLQESIRILKQNQVQNSLKSLDLVIKLFQMAVISLKEVDKTCLNKEIAALNMAKYHMTVTENQINLLAQVDTTILTSEINGQIKKLKESFKNAKEFTSKYVTAQKAEEGKAKKIVFTYFPTGEKFKGLALFNSEEDKKLWVKYHIDVDPIVVPFHQLYCEDHPGAGSCFLIVTEMNQRLDTTFDAVMKEAGTMTAGPTQPKTDQTIPLDQIIPRFFLDDTNPYEAEVEFPSFEASRTWTRHYLELMPLNQLCADRLSDTESRPYKCTFRIKLDFQNTSNTIRTILNKAMEDTMKLPLLKVVIQDPESSI